MDYRVASTVDEALALLDGGGHRRAVAGGTDLAVVIADGVIAPDLLVDVAGIGAMRAITRTADGIAIGAAVTIAEVAARAELPACLRQGARAIGSPQIRNLATIGGNACNASPCGDTLAPLAALGASFVLASRQGRRTVPAEEFFLGPKRTVVKPGELLVEILVPARSLAGGSGFRMIGKRNGQAISQVNAAAWALVEKGTIREVRAAVGSVAPVPLRLKKAEALLAGRPVKSLDRAALLAAVDSEIAPISDVRASLDYRRLVTGSLFADALGDALGEGIGAGE
jgi:CO/xanthine dehydrogenase FAD-binding subunit